MILLFSSCDSDDKNEASDVKKVLLVYIGADNNGLDNTRGEVNLRIQSIGEGYDGDPSKKILIYSDPNGKESYLYEIVKEKEKSVAKIIKTYYSDNSADPKVFNRFITEAKNTYYEAESFGLIVWSHASGWLPQKTLTNPKSIIIDGSDEMELTDFASAIPDKMFDYIVFEPCFMAGIEVMYELKNKADYIFASSAEIWSPGYIETYPEGVKHLFNNDLARFGDLVYKNVTARTGSNATCTFSLIKTSELENIASFVKKNADFTKFLSLDISNIQSFDRYPGYRLFFDFEDYFIHLMDENNPELKVELKSILDKGVVWKKNTDVFYTGQKERINIRSHSGLTSYIEQSDFPYLNSEYKKLAWYKAINRY